MAVPSPVPDLFLRYLPRREQPSHHVESPSILPIHQLPPRGPRHESDPMVHIARPLLNRRPNLRPQAHLLLRGRPPRVRPPNPRQFLLRTVDRPSLLRHWNAAVDFPNPTPISLVRSNGADSLSGGQDLRAVDVRRSAAAL